MTSFLFQAFTLPSCPGSHGRTIYHEFHFVPSGAANSCPHDQPSPPTTADTVLLHCRPHPPPHTHPPNSSTHFSAFHTSRSNHATRPRTSRTRLSRVLHTVPLQLLPSPPCTALFTSHTSHAERHTAAHPATVMPMRNDCQPRPCTTGRLLLRPPLLQLLARLCSSF